MSALPNSTGRRTALAAWITRPDNPLSTRVIVNRVWQYHFGRGIAGTPNDLGKLGETPTHPELLDWLAKRFVDEGLEPETAASRHSPFGDVSSDRAHPTFRDERRRWILRTSTSGGSVRAVSMPSRCATRCSPRAANSISSAVGGPSQEANASSRRAIYTIKKRNNQNELLRAMDAPAGFTSIAERQGTSTPLQALLFMNGDWMIARARKLATQAPEHRGSVAGRAGPRADARGETNLPLGSSRSGRTGQPASRANDRES